MSKKIFFIVFSVVFVEVTGYSAFAGLFHRTRVGNISSAEEADISPEIGQKFYSDEFDLHTYIDEMGFDGVIPEERMTLVGDVSIAAHMQGSRGIEREFKHTIPFMPFNAPVCFKNISSTVESLDLHPSMQSFVSNLQEGKSFLPMFYFLHFASSGSKSPVGLFFRGEATGTEEVIDLKESPFLSHLSNALSFLEEVNNNQHLKGSARALNQKPKKIKKKLFGGDPCNFSGKTLFLTYRLHILHQTEKPSHDLGLLRAAAQHGSVEAKNALGVFLLNYEIGQHWKSQARTFLKEASKAQHRGAQVNFARFVYCYERDRSDLSETQSILEKFSGEGNGENAYLAGVMSFAGLGVPVDYEKAKSLWEKGAALGHQNCLYALGTLYDGGKGVEKNRCLAFHCYEKAAEQGHKRAQFIRARMLFQGKGCIQDIPRAFTLMQAAAESGLPRAQFFLGVFYYWGVENSNWGDYKISKENFLLAAKQNHVESLYWLGKLYEEGRGGGRLPDYKKARKFYKQAEKKGSLNGKFHRAVLDLDGKGIFFKRKRGALKRLTALSVQGHAPAQRLLNA